MNKRKIFPPHYRHPNDDADVRLQLQTHRSQSMDSELTATIVFISQDAYFAHPLDKVGQSCES